MTAPLDSATEKKDRVAEKPDRLASTHAEEAVKALETVVKEKTVSDVSRWLPSGEALLAQMADTVKDKHQTPASSETVKRDSGTVTADRDAKGQIIRIAESDGTEWNRSADGKFMVLNTTGDKVSVKDVKFEKDGSYTLELPDGQQVKRNADRSVSTFDQQGHERHRSNINGTQVLFDDQNRVTATLDAAGQRRGYGYDADGKLTAVFDPDGSLWSSSDGKNWQKNGTDKARTGEVSVNASGDQTVINSNGDKATVKLEGRAEITAQIPAEAPAVIKPVDQKAMEVAADAIEYACNGGTGIGTDEKTIFATLENKSEAERKAITEIWNRKYGAGYGHDLEAEFKKEMSGSELEQSLALLKRPDGADNAGTLRVALVEGGEWGGRSSGELGKIVRNTLETMSAADIAKTDAEYTKRYGQSLSDAISGDPNLSADTKAAAAVYLKGFDQRTADDTKALAVNAAKAGNVDMFEESMRRAPQVVRDYFAGPEGQKLMKDNFEGQWYNSLTLGLSGRVNDTDYRHVQDYANQGKLSVNSQVTDNRSWLGDNEEAIAHSLATMSDSERLAYANGRKIANNETVPDLTAEQKQSALDYYNQTSTALKAAAGSMFGDSQANEFAKWEDMISQKGGSIVSRLAEHRGFLYDSSMSDVLGTVEGMSKEDWTKLSSDPAQRGKIDEVLKTYLSDDDRKRVMDLVDSKLKAGSFEESQQSRRPVLDTIEDNRHWYGDDKSQMYHAIETMTDSERELYRKGSDPASGDQAARAFAQSLDDKLKASLAESQQRVAFGLLEKVKNGEKPEMGIVDKLNQHATDWFGDKAQTVRDIQAAFEHDSQLRARIANPQNDADRALAAQFVDAGTRALGAGDWATYGKPLMETGTIPVELQMKLNQGLFNDDEQNAYKDIQHASAADKQRILTDQAFQDRVLGFLSADERRVALVSMQQSEMRPEDKLRSYQLGLGTSESDIKSVLGELNDRTKLKTEGKSEAEIDTIIQDRLKHVRDEYARKYGSDLSADLVSELGGKDQRQALRQVASRDQRSELLYSLNDAAQTRSGLGSAFVDKAWDGTGYQLDNEINQLARTAVEDPSKIRDHVEDVYKMIDMHASSKEALADAVVDTTVAAVAVGGAFFTGGVSLSLLAYTGAGAAVFKVGTKAAIMGGDYDTASSQLWLDGATGFADGFTTFLGAAAAKSAAEKMLTTGGKALLKEGSEKTLQEGTELLVKEGLNAGGKISDEAITTLAKQLAKEGDEEAVSALLKKSLSEAIEEQSRTMLKQMVLNTPSNMLAGMAGSGLSGSIKGAAEAKDFADFARIAATSTAFGALGGAAGGLVLAPGVVAASKSWNAIRSVMPADFKALNLTAVLAAHASTGLPDTHFVQPVLDSNLTAHVRETVVPERIEGPQTIVVEPRKTALPDAVVDQPVVDQPVVAGKQITVEKPANSENPVVAEKPVVKDAANDNAVVAREATDATPTKFEPSRIAEFSAEIERKFTDAPVSMEQFKSVFSGMSESDRKLALELLEQSAPNMHSRKLDLQMEALNKKIGQMPVSKEDPLKVFVLSGDTSGNALAQILKKNAGHTPIEIVELDGPALKAMAESGSIPKNGLIFDDIAQANPAQKELLAKVRNLMVADMGGFNKGLNLFDFGAAKFAGPELIQEKLQSLIADARKVPGNTNMSDQELARKVLQGDTRAQATELNANATVFDAPLVDNSGKKLRVDASEGQPAATVERHQIESLYQEFTTPLVTKEQINDYLGAMGADRQAIAAHILRDGLHYQSYSTMMGQMRDLHAMVLSQLPAGKTVKDILIVTGAEKNGSEYLINHLYGKVNGLTKDNFVSLAELKSRGPGAADGKVVMYVDDYSYSGRQAVGMVRDHADVLRDSGGKVVVGTLGRYQTSRNPWDLHLTDSRYAAVAGVNATPLSPNEYPGFYQYVQNSSNPMNGLFTLEQIQKVAGDKTALKGSEVTANLLMPYGGPNNNLKFIAEFARRMKLPGR